MAEDDDERWVCASCISEPFFSATVEEAGDIRTCSFCDEEGPAISIEDLADRVEAAFDTHFYRTATGRSDLEYTMLKDPEGSYEWEREGEPVILAIADAAGVSEAVVQEVQEVLDYRFGDFDAAAAGEETEFDGGSHYCRKGPNDVEFQLEWVHLERSLKSETRFFNKAAAGHLDRLFAEVGAYRTVMVARSSASQVPERSSRALAARGSFTSAWRSIARWPGPTSSSARLRAQSPMPDG